MASTTFVDKVTVVPTDWLNDVNGVVWTLFGGTSVPATARTALGLGTIATQAANSVAITGGTIAGTTITGGTVASLSSPLAVASGGTGVTTSTGTTAVVLSTGPTISGATLTGTNTITGTAAFSNTTTAPTKAKDNSSTEVATTAFVLGQTSTQAELEAGSSTTTFASPGRIQYHPSSAKAWVKCDTAGNILASYNVTSVATPSAGRLTVTFTTAFSSASYCALATVQYNLGILSAVVNNGTPPTTTTCDFICYNAASAATSPNLWYAVFYGDQ